MKTDLPTQTNNASPQDLGEAKRLKRTISDLQGEIAVVKPENQHLKLKLQRYEALILLAIDALDFTTGDWNNPEIHRAEQIKIAKKHLLDIGVEDKETAA